MKRTLLLAAACLAVSLVQAAPPIPLDQLQLRVTYRPVDAPGIGGGGSSMYNCRFFDGSVYAPQINNYCWARFPRGSSIAAAAAKDRQTRMVSPIPGTTYLLACGGTLTNWTRYDFDGTNPVDAGFPDDQKVESFDWVDDNTIICNDYTLTTAPENYNRLYLIHVNANPFSLTRTNTWNSNGWVPTPVTKRIRNVRVGQTDPNFAFYGDNGVADNPKFYAIDLRSGDSTELGHWDGVLKSPPDSHTSSWGLWTVVERGGYLYLQSSDDGIQVYSMSGSTNMGAMVASFSKEQLQAITGGGAVPYYGFDVAADDKGLILGDFSGNVFELQRRAPALSGQWQLRGIVEPRLNVSPQQQANTTYNPRFFDGNIYATQISDPTCRCFGYFDGATLAYLGGGIPSTNEYRMLGRLRGPGGSTYLMGTSGWDGVNPLAPVFLPTFTRHDFDSWASNPVPTNSIDNQVVESFDWVNDDTMISTCYMSGQRKKLYLTDVNAATFELTRNTLWHANGYAENTSLTSRIRNVRVGQTYSDYAYYGDAGQTNHPAFYAINLATGVSTLLGDAGPLSVNSGSYGLWTVVERGNYLYVQTTDDGIQVYGPMINATNKGPLFATYTQTELDTLTGVLSDAQYYGMDLSVDAGKMLLGAAFGKVYVLERAFDLSITKSGDNVILSWPSYYAGAVVESSSTLQPWSFADLFPQPAKVAAGDRVSATIAIDPAAPVFFRLRN